MMEVARIADQLKHAFEADPWHGPALLEVLEGVNAAQAAARPQAGAHSIWELAQHLTAWKRAVCVRLGGQAIELVGEKDWPPVGDTSEAAWQKTLADLKEAHKQVMRAVEELPDARLEDKVPGRDHTVYFMLHGLVQHDAYHGGQIALLKKA